MFFLKIRQGFVTNSSSSSFLIAKSEGFTDEQKMKLLKQIEDLFFGEVELAKGSSEEEIRKYADENLMDVEQVRKLVVDKDIRHGSVDYEDCVYTLQNLYSTIWDAVRGDTNIEFIEDDLSY